MDVDNEEVASNHNKQHRARDNSRRMAANLSLSDAASDHLQQERELSLE